MSPRRRLLLAVVAGAVVVVLAIVVGLALAARGPSVDPDSRPAQDVLGPVLLVPGYGGSQASLAPLAQRLRAAGRDARVLALVGDGRGDLSAQVVALDAAVDEALAGGAPSVDVVGYSAGGVVAGLWVARADGAAKARRIVAIGAPLAGTSLASLGAAEAPDACPTACRQLAPGSTLLAELSRADVGAALPWLSVWTADDRTVTPPESARLPGAVNVRLQDLCPGAVVSHDALPANPAVAELVTAALGTTPLVAAPGCPTP
jgi:triacylglycerol esterase/lipase EstA (alpha/beta hydrolase family)